jgi:aldehyde dehydrogenase (NAD+)
MKTITTHYIDGTFVESHGREAMDSINPSNGEVIARAMLADEEDARRAIAAAKRAFTSFGRTTKDERANVLRRLHEVVAAHVDDLTAAMVTVLAPRLRIQKFRSRRPGFQREV